MAFQRYPCLLAYCLFLILSFSTASSLAQDQQETSVPIGALAKGVSIYYTVTEENGQLLHLDDAINQITQDDVFRLKQAGMTHIRLAVSPYPLMHDDHFDQNVWNGRNARIYLQNLHHLIGLFADNHMAVVLAVMPNEQSFERLYYKPEYAQEWVRFFHAWAYEFSHYDSSLLAFETLNEPRFVLFLSRDEPIVAAGADTHYPDPLLEKANALWIALENRFLDAIRSEAPYHTLIATADGFSDAKALSLRDPSTYSNIIYAFHYYLPYMFTHQSADWSDFPGRYVEGLSYPSEWNNCTKVKATAPADAKSNIDQYCATGWNRERHQQELSILRDWSKHYGVPVWMGEFGAYPYKTDHDSVIRYYNDVRLVAESYGFGWCAWEYTIWLSRLQDTSWLRR